MVAERNATPPVGGGGIVLESREILTAFVAGDVVQVPDDTIEMEEIYFGGANAFWKITSIAKSTEWPIASLFRLGQPAQRRSLLTSGLQVVPAALR